MNTTETAVFGGGCFWCTEAVYMMLRGVESVLPGYSGGAVSNPSYDDVSSGRTGHAEVIKIEFEPDKISYKDILTVFFASHDPTTLNRQGNDIGTQYRSIILYTNEKQKEEADKYIEELNNASKKGGKIVTEIKPFEVFYEAEDYHKNYYERNKNKSYCEVIINPKLDKVQQKFADLLKEKVR